MFTIAKRFAFVFLAASIVSARPPQHTSLVTCEYGLTPDVIVNPNAINLVTEFNFVIGTSLSSILPPNTVTDSTSSTFVDNGDNTFSATESIGVEGKTAQQTAAILSGLSGITHSGFANGGTINWTINSVACPT